MRSLPLRLASLVLLPTALLAGCADDPNAKPTASATTTKAPAVDLSTIKVTAAATPGTPHTLTLPSKPFKGGDPAFRVVTPGTGAAVADGSMLGVQYTAFSGVDGRQLETSPTAGVTLDLSDQDVPEIFRSAVKGQKVGALVLVTLQANLMHTDASLPKGVGMDDTLLYVLKLASAKAPLTAATGTAVPPKAGLPTVTMGATAADPAKIAVPSPTALKETITQPLITGTGEKVQKGQTVRVTYTGTTWRDPATPFDYSGKSPKKYFEFVAGAGNVIKAWDAAVVGQPVGSRLLLIVQPVDGYGDKGNGDIKGDDVMIFVVDILAAY